MGADLLHSGGLAPPGRVPSVITPALADVFSPCPRGHGGKKRESSCCLQRHQVPLDFDLNIGLCVQPEGETALGADEAPHLLDDTLPESAQ